MTLVSTDWNEEWKTLQRSRQNADSAAVWDKRAKTFPVKHGSQSGYVSAFLSKASILPNERVLDMGCGTGALATPLAQMGNEVVACDFSSGMLGAMKRDHLALGVEGVIVHQMSWEDDWLEHGIGEKSVDVALASRSIAVNDLKAAFEKLNHTARRRVCITLPAGPSPKVDNSLLAAAGISPQVGSDFLYAFNILAGMGTYPEVAYIPSVREDLFDSKEQALRRYVEIVSNAVKGTVSQGQHDAIPEHLSAWLDENLASTDDGVKLKKPRVVTWAFMAWEPR